MKYPKQLMSITELRKMGFSRDSLYQAARAEGNERYIVWTKGKGKILFDTEKWEKTKGQTR